MEKVTARRQRVLDILDVEIEELETKLQKVQPLINELNHLKATRRALLSERGTTSGGGSRGQLSMEMVVKFLQENGPSTPQEIAEHYGVPGASVRSHLQRHKDVRYMRDEDGQWLLTENSKSEEEEEDD